MEVLANVSETPRSKCNVSPTSTLFIATWESAETAFGDHIKVAR
jgi:hypothetical protein